MSEPTLAAVETAAVPLVQAVVKALKPQAEAFLQAFAAHAEAEGAKLKASVEQLVTEHHAGLLGWIQEHLVKLPGDGSSDSGEPVDPSPAPPAATA